uniref:MADF domain-containing protein n=1 Tax=Timema monikensis TaxID=170555 RepID=A0A7R9EHW1_9NEOP|nr:unnamed protein product [Timema monikensis]
MDLAYVMISGTASLRVEVATKPRHVNCVHSGSVSSLRNMTDIRHASKEFLTRFIEIYKSHPALWKVKSKEYANRNLKNAGYDALVEFYRKVDSKADRDFVAKKIQSLRGSFRKELKKFVKSRKSGASSDDHYVPSLWYFDLLSFTWEHETPSESVDTTMDSPSSQTDDNLDADNPDTCLAQVNEAHDEEHETQASNTKDIGRKKDLSESNSYREWSLVSLPRLFKKPLHLPHLRVVVRARDPFQDIAQSRKTERGNEVPLSLFRQTGTGNRGGGGQVSSHRTTMSPRPLPITTLTPLSGRITPATRNAVMMNDVTKT